MAVKPAVKQGHIDLGRQTSHQTRHAAHSPALGTRPFAEQVEIPPVVSVMETEDLVGGTPELKLVVRIWFPLQAGIQTGLHQSKAQLHISAFAEKKQISSQVLHPHLSFRAYFQGRPVQSGGL